VLSRLEMQVPMGGGMDCRSGAVGGDPSAVERIPSGVPLGDSGPVQSFGDLWAAAPPPQAVEEAQTVGVERRREILAQAIASHLASPGAWRVEQQTDTYAIFVRGEPIKHVLHLLLTLLTTGLWAFVWIAIVVRGGERRCRVTVDDYGNEEFETLGIWRWVAPQTHPVTGEGTSFP
jgi:hypothetical protein